MFSYRSSPPSRCRVFVFTTNLEKSSEVTVDVSMISPKHLIVGDSLGSTLGEELGFVDGELLGILLGAALGFKLGK